MAPFSLRISLALVFRCAAFLVAVFLGFASVIHSTFDIVAPGLLQRLLTRVLLDWEFVLAAVGHTHTLGTA